MEKEISLRDRVMLSLKERRERLLNNKLNCIPSPFKRFREDFIGIEQGSHIVVTASTKGAKSQFTSYTFIYKPLLFLLDLFFLPYYLSVVVQSVLLAFVSFLFSIQSANWETCKVSPSLFSSFQIKYFNRRR